MFYTPYVRSIVRLQRQLMRNKWDTLFASIAYADIVESRSFLLTHWYDKTDATHLLFIDADMGYEPQLIVDMVQLRKPVVGVGSLYGRGIAKIKKGDASGNVDTAAAVAIDAKIEHDFKRYDVR